MINTPSEYKYVTGLEQFVINGQIKPIRSDAPLSLRGEDLAFLAEAQGELNNDCGLASDIVDLSRKLSFSQAQSLLNPAGAFAYNPEAELYNGKFVEFTPSGDPNVDDVANALGLTKVVLPDVESGLPRITNKMIDDAFERIKACGRVYRGVPQSARNDVEWQNRNQGNALPPGTGTWTDYNTSSGIVRKIKSHGEKYKSGESSGTWSWWQEGRVFRSPHGTALTYALPDDYGDAWQLWDVYASVYSLRYTGEFSANKHFALVTAPDVDWFMIATTYILRILNSMGGAWGDGNPEKDGDAYNYGGGYYVKNFDTVVTAEARQCIIDVSDRIKW